VVFTHSSGVDTAVTKDATPPKITRMRIPETVSLNRTENGEPAREAKGEVAE
jgi:hypothetical protein